MTALVLNRRILARVFWPAALASLRQHGLLFSPQAWLVVIWQLLRIRFGDPAEIVVTLKDIDP